MTSRTLVCALLALVVSFGSTVALGQEAAPTTAAPAAKVLARVGAEEITDVDLQMAMDRMLRGQTPPAEVMPQIRKSILDSLVTRSLIQQFIAAQKVTVTPEELDAKIAEIKQQVAASGFNFEMLLQDEGITLDEMKTEIAQEMAMGKYLDAQVTDEKAKAAFDADPKAYDGTEVKASHILLSYEPDSTDADKAAAKQKLAGIRAEIAAGGDFAAAAKQHSACPSKAEGGDLGFFPRHGKMVEPFAAAAFGLPVGEVSQPVETEFGAHLIKVTEIKPGTAKYEDAAEQVKGALIEQVVQQMADAQRKVTKVEILN